MHQIYKFQQSCHNINLQLIEMINWHNIRKILLSKSSLTQSVNKLPQNCLFSTVNQRNKDSKWIYSSKYDEMQAMKKGRIYVTTQTGNDSHDVTLRMYQALMQTSSCVFSYNPSQTKMLLRALSKKDKLVDRQLHFNAQQAQVNASQIIPSPTHPSSLINCSVQQSQQKSFQQQIQLSKYVDMQVDMQKILKKQNDPGNVNLIQRQRQLKIYLRNRQFRTQLQNVKSQQGYPQVLPIIHDKDDIQYFYHNGIDVTYVLHQFQINTSNYLLTTLQQLSLPYQILPAKSQLVNAIVISGFPADRFSIQYFPQNLQEVLIRRKKSKLTVAMIIKRLQLQKAMQSISMVYGKQHLIFVQNKSSGLTSSFRGQIHLFYDWLKHNPLNASLQQIKIIISPFISQFNQSLKQQQHKIRHIYGEAQSQKTNFIDLEILGQKLGELRKKDATHQIDIFSMVDEMIHRMGNTRVVRIALRNMLALADNQIDFLINQSQKRIKIDYVGLKQYQQDMNRKLKGKSQLKSK